MCSKLMIGTGNVAGSLSEDSENARLVEERPCNVNGKSRSNWASVGASSGFAEAVGSGDASTDRVDARNGILSLDCGSRTGSGSSGLGTLGRPLREKASLKAGASLLCCRKGGCGRGVGEGAASGAAPGSESDNRYKKYRMAHFLSRTGWLSNRE